MHCIERIIPYHDDSNASDPSSARWDTITGILARIVHQSRAADVLLSQETIASIVAILPCIPAPL